MYRYSQNRSFEKVELPGARIRKTSRLVEIFIVLAAITSFLLVYIASNCPSSSKDNLSSFCKVSSDLFAPSFILLSSLIGARIALISILSNRREFVRKNTIDVLNALEQDDIYWQASTELISRIEAIMAARCPECPNGRVECLEQEELEKIDYDIVLRKLEWLMELAYLGHLDWQELAKRKGAMINYVYTACAIVIANKVERHALRYGAGTAYLVYQHLRTREFRELLYDEVRDPGNNKTRDLPVSHLVSSKKI
ncbi:hypothetical protein [Vibrio harveyi]